MKMTMTMAWNTKNTDAEPIDARARISRGKDTFFTRPALFTTTPVPVWTPTWNRFHTSRPENKKITKWGTPFLAMNWNTMK